MRASEGEPVKMPTMALIISFFKSKGSEVLITTRELLKFGLRSCVDSCVFELVKDQVIVRVARGVFHLAGRNTPVGIEEVAAVKARAFGRDIMKDACRIAEELDLCPKSQSEIVQHSFQIDGRSSAFKFGTITIKLKGTSKKNFALGDTPEGQALRALLAMGKGFVTEDIFERTMQKLPTTQQLSVLNSCSFVSAWLGDLMLRWFFNARTASTSQSIISVVIAEESDKKHAGNNLISEYMPDFYGSSATRNSYRYLQKHQTSYIPAASNFARRNE